MTRLKERKQPRCAQLREPTTSAPGRAAPATLPLLCQTVAVLSPAARAQPEALPTAAQSPPLTPTRRSHWAARALGSARGAGGGEGLPIGRHQLFPSSFTARPRSLQLTEIPRGWGGEGSGRSSLSTGSRPRSGPGPAGPAAWAPAPPPRRPAGWRSPLASAARPLRSSPPSPPAPSPFLSPRLWDSGEGAGGRHTGPTPLQLSPGTRAGGRQGGAGRARPWSGGGGGGGSTSDRGRTGGERAGPPGAADRTAQLSKSALALRAPPPASPNPATFLKLQPIL